MLELCGVTHAYGEKTVLESLSHVFPARGVVALMGPSGCGKTTLLRLIAGLESPAAGEVRNDFLRISVSFQEPRLLPWLKVRENVRLVLPRGNDPDEVDRLLDDLGLGEVADRFPGALSGGMKQRLSLARALAYGGDLLLLDEPFSALDRDLKVQVAELIRAANPEGLTLVVTHSEEEAALLGADILTPDGTPIRALLPRE